MPTTLSAQEFVNKWRGVKLKESSAAQEHFLDLCHLIGHPTPVDDDPTGERFCFEAGAIELTVEAQKAGSFHPNWLRNAVLDPLDESDVGVGQGCTAESPVRRVRQNVREK